MIVYAAFLLLMMLGFFIKKNKPLTIYFFVLFCLLFSLRSFNVGADIKGYTSEFIKISRTEWAHLFSEQNTFAGYEKGFIVFCKLASYITKDGNVYLLICASIIYGCLLSFFSFIDKKNISKQVLMFICLPSFSVLLSGIRQAFAVSFILVAFVLFRKRKFLKALLFYLLAISFHVTAILGVLLVLARFIRVKKKHIWSFVAIGIIVFAFRAHIATVIFDKLAQYSDKIEFYKVEGNDSYTMIIFYLLILIFLFVFSGRDNENDKSFLENRNIVFVLFLLQFFASVQTNLMRTTYYFLPFLPTTIISVIDHGKLKMHRAVLLLCVLAFLFVMYFYFIDGSTQSELTPYEFFWE